MQLLEETRRRLGDRPWGVGILGFVPQELRAEQLEVIRTYRPAFALIAGGRPDQSRILDEEGVPTYLHVPSPGLLRMFLKEGARRFVFEGRECGGHVGPRTSFVLWESMIEVLAEHLTSGVDASAYHVLFAGGVHDGLSAAMVGALAAPLIRRGVRVGVLAGYGLPLHPRGGPDRRDRRRLSASGPLLRAHGFARERPGACDPMRVVSLRHGLRRREATPDPARLPPEELRHNLEELNIGRLRIASKGVDHGPRLGTDQTAANLVELGPEEQWTRRHVHDRPGRRTPQRPLHDGRASRGDLGREHPATEDVHAPRRGFRTAIPVPRGGRDHRNGVHPARRSRPKNVLVQHPQQGRCDHGGARRPLGLAPVFRCVSVGA